MPTIFEDNFNSYNNGPLAGQGGWVGDETALVQEAVKKEGAKAVSIAGGQLGSYDLYKSGSFLPDGRIAFYMRRSSNNSPGRFKFDILDSLISNICFQVSFLGATSKIQYRTGELYIDLQSYIPDQWYLIEAEWRSSDNKVRLRVDKGSWTNWVNREPSYIPSQIGLWRDENTENDTIFFDYIAENALSTDVYHIYRGQDGVIDYENIQAEMPLEDSSISIPNQALPPGTIWHYIRRQVSDCDGGKESKDSPLCKVVIDTDGDMVPLCPNPPMDLVVVPVAGGKFELRWRYNASDQEIPPSGFKMYLVDNGEWTLLDTIPCIIGGWGEFQWTSAAFDDGERCYFCVRSYAVGESQNTNLVSATADAVGPPVITGLEAVVEEV
jgi:hypothetical protein